MAPDPLLPFAYHLFISYARRDNQLLLEGQEKGWVTSFRTTLKLRLEELLGEEVKVWWDNTNIRGNHALKNVIVDALAETAALITVLTPSYLNSTWCAMELEQFRLGAQKRLGEKIGNRSRLFKVVKTPVPLADHPAPLQEQLGYEFYRHDPDSDRHRELRQGIGRRDMEIGYLTKIDDLALDICKLLKLMRQSVPPEPPAPAAPAPVIFLAESTFDLAADRDRVQRFAQQQGCTVLPDRPLPVHSPDLGQRIKEDLERSQLSIHMLGATYGVIPEGADRQSLAALQNQIAAQRCCSGPGLERLIWMPPGLVVSDERQQLLVEHLLDDADAHRGADIIQDSLEELRAVLEEKLRPSPRAATAAAAEHMLIYLICDQCDVAATMDLQGALQDRGYQVLLPSFGTDETEVREDHQEKLVHCDGVLVFCGRAREMWLHIKVRELSKAIGYGQRTDAGRHVTAVYLGPPALPFKQRFRTSVAPIIEGCEGFSQALLDDFLLLLEGLQAG
jgi:hypothetical protein